MPATGNKPAGYLPIQGAGWTHPIWECENCKALISDVSGHEAWHTKLHEVLHNIISLTEETTAMSDDIRRKHGSGNQMHCFRDDHELWQEIMGARRRAHEKHGANSIEAIFPDDPGWLSILVEEVGEASHELTYDSDGTRASLRAELVDIACVVTAWIDAIDNELEA